jgi:protein-tyrosine phosphatase
VDWPDFGLPADPAAFLAALEDVMARARRVDVVELGCLGGHGRTGTALACLAALTGVEGDPVEWVRSTYCENAVETDEQAEFARQTRRSPR